MPQYLYDGITRSEEDIFNAAQAHGLSIGEYLTKFPDIQLVEDEIQGVDITKDLTEKITTKKFYVDDSTILDPELAALGLDNGAYIKQTKKTGDLYSHEIYDLYGNLITNYGNDPAIEYQSVDVPQPMNLDTYSLPEDDKKTEIINNKKEQALKLHDEINTTFTTEVPVDDLKPTLYEIIGGSTEQWDGSVWKWLQENVTPEDLPESNWEPQPYLSGGGGGGFEARNKIIKTDWTNPLTAFRTRNGMLNWNEANDTGVDEELWYPSPDEIINGTWLVNLNENAVEAKQSMLDNLNNEHSLEL